MPHEWAAFQLFFSSSADTHEKEHTQGTTRDLIELGQRYHYVECFVTNILQWDSNAFQTYTSYFSLYRLCEMIDVHLLQLLRYKLIEIEDELCIIAPTRRSTPIEEQTDLILFILSQLSDFTDTLTMIYHLTQTFQTILTETDQNIIHLTIWDTLRSCVITGSSRSNQLLHHLMNVWVSHYICIIRQFLLEDTIHQTTNHLLDLSSERLTPLRFFILPCSTYNQWNSTVLLEKQKSPFFLNEEHSRDVFSVYSIKISKVLTFAWNQSYKIHPSFIPTKLFTYGLSTYILTTWKIIQMIRFLNHFDKLTNLFHFIQQEFAFMESIFVLQQSVQQDHSCSFHLEHLQTVITKGFHHIYQHANKTVLSILCDHQYHQTKRFINPFSLISTSVYPIVSSVLCWIKNLRDVLLLGQSSFFNRLFLTLEQLHQCHTHVTEHPRHVQMNSQTRIVWNQILKNNGYPSVQCLDSSFNPTGLSSQEDLWSSFYHFSLDDMPPIHDEERLTPIKSQLIMIHTEHPLTTCNSFLQQINIAFEFSFLLSIDHSQHTYLNWELCSDELIDETYMYGTGFQLVADCHLDDHLIYHIDFSLLRVNYSTGEYLSHVTDYIEQLNCQCQRHDIKGLLLCRQTLQFKNITYCECVLSYQLDPIPYFNVTLLHPSFDHTYSYHIQLPIPLHILPDFHTFKAVCIVHQYSTSINNSHNGTIQQLRERIFDFLPIPRFPPVILFFFETHLSLYYDIYDTLLFPIQYVSYKTTTCLFSLLRSKRPCSSSTAMKRRGETPIQTITQLSVCYQALYELRFIIEHLRHFFQIDIIQDEVIHVMKQIQTSSVNKDIYDIIKDLHKFIEAIKRRCFLNHLSICQLIKRFMQHGLTLISLCTQVIDHTSNVSLQLLQQDIQWRRRDLKKDIQQFISEIVYIIPFSNNSLSLESLINRLTINSFFMSPSKNENASILQSSPVRYKHTDPDNPHIHQDPPYQKINIVDSTLVDNHTTEKTSCPISVPDQFRILSIKLQELKKKSILAVTSKRLDSVSNPAS